MKKILALTMAAAMMTTTAFAAELIRPNDNMVEPGTYMSFDADGFFYMDGSDMTSADLLGHFTDAEGKDVAEIIAGDKGEDFNRYDFTSDNFTITLKLKKGSGLVERYGIDDDTNRVDIKLKKNNLLEAPKDGKAPNFVIEEIKARSRRTIKDDKYSMKSGKSFCFDLKKETGKYGDTEMRGFVHFDPEDAGAIAGGAVDLTEWFVGYDGSDSNVTELDGDDVDYKEGFNHFKEAGEPRATATFDKDGVIIEGRVYDDDKVYVNVDQKFTDKVKEIWKANDSIDPDLSVYNVELEGVNGAHKITFEDVEEGYYFYEMDANGKLTKSNVKWDKDEYAYKGTIRHDTTYIVSDKQLKAVSSGSNGNSSNNGTDNPDTGANDVVGLATAIGAVSLIAAGALCLKKK